MLLLTPNPKAQWTEFKCSLPTQVLADIKAYALMSGSGKDDVVLEAVERLTSDKEFQDWKAEHQAELQHNYMRNLGHKEMLENLASDLDDLLFGHPDVALAKARESVDVSERIDQAEAENPMVQPFWSYRRERNAEYREGQRKALAEFETRIRTGQGATGL